MIYTHPVASKRIQLMLHVLNLLFWTAICFTPPTDDYGKGIIGGGITHPFYIIKILGVIAPVGLAVLYGITSAHFRKAIVSTLYVQRHVYYYVLFSAIALIWAYFPTVSAGKLIIFSLSLVALTMLISMYFHFMNVAAYRAMIRHTTTAFLLFTAFFFVNYIMGLSQGLDVDAMREAVASHFVHPNIAAATAIFGSVFLFFITTASPRTTQLTKWVIIGASCVITLAVIMGLNSRGGLAAALVAVGIAFIIRAPLAGFATAIIGAAAVILFIGFSQNIMMSILSKMSRSGDISEIFTLTNRSIIWDTMFSDYSTKDFLIGHGYAAVSNTFGVEISSNGYDYVFTFGAHNMFFQVLLGTGLFGLILFLIILLRIGHYGFKRHFSTLVRTRPHIPVIIPFIYVLIQGLLEHLFGLNLSPAFAILLMVFTAGIMDDAYYKQQPQTNRPL